MSEPRPRTDAVVRSPWADPTTRKLLLFNLVLTLLTAWTSETYFHPDEHMQIIEFVGLKLGFTQPEELTWEFLERARPFTQPALYYALLKPLIGLGLSDRFLMTFVMRLASALFAFSALVSLLRTSAPWMADADADRSRIRWLTLSGFLPYLAVRTTSENLSTSFFLFALAQVVRDKPPERASEPSSARAGLTAGLLLGMCFECRYQMAFCILGLLAWLWFIARDRKTPLWILLGGTLPVLSALLVDRWGYGEWTFPPWHYVRTNLIEGKAAEFGTKWFFGYLHITLANIFAPLVILAIVGLTLCWIRRPRHVLTWVTLPFVFAHSAIGHKEERYLFPVLLLGLVGAALGYQAGPSPSNSRLSGLAEKVAALFRRFQRAWLYRGLVVWNFFGMALLAVYPLGWRPHQGFEHWAHDLAPPIHLAYDDPKLVSSTPFFRKHPLHLHMLQKGERVDTIETGGAPVYWLRPEPFTSFDAAALGVSSQLVYTEFPGASVEWLRESLWPLLGSLRTRAVAGGYQAKRATWITAYPSQPSGSQAP